MAGQVKLPGGRQPVSPVVAPAADDQGVASGEPGAHQSAHPQGRPLHQHGSRDSYVLDRRPVHLPHLGGGEDCGPVEERMGVTGAVPAGAGADRRPLPSRHRRRMSEESRPSRYLPTNVRPPPDKPRRRHRRATARPGGPSLPAPPPPPPSARRASPGQDPPRGDPPAPRSPARRRCLCPRVYQPLPWPRTARRSAGPAWRGPGSRRSPPG